MRSCTDCLGPAVRQMLIAVNVYALSAPVVGTRNSAFIASVCRLSTIRRSFVEGVIFFDQADKAIYIQLRRISSKDRTQRWLSKLIDRYQGVYGKILYLTDLRGIVRQNYSSVNTMFETALIQERLKPVSGRIYLRALTTPPPGRCYLAHNRIRQILYHGVPVNGPDLAGRYRQLPCGGGD